MQQRNLLGFCVAAMEKIGMKKTKSEPISDERAAEIILLALLAEQEKRGAPGYVGFARRSHEIMEKKRRKQEKQAEKPDTDVPMTIPELAAEKRRLSAGMDDSVDIDLP